MIKKILKDNRGEGYIDYAVGFVCFMLIIAFAIQFLPVFTVKQRLDIFATEIVREAEIAGSTDIDDRIEALIEQTDLDPTIVWECNYYQGEKVQINENIKVTLEVDYDLGFFEFGSFPITIVSKATGKSEVYYK